MTTTRAALLATTGTLKDDMNRLKERIDNTVENLLIAGAMALSDDAKLKEVVEFMVRESQIDRLLEILENTQEELDFLAGIVGAVIRDSRKVLDSLPHDGRSDEHLH